MMVPSAKLPDIGEASFGAPPPLAEIVHPPDDRVQITNTEVYPWRVHCCLQITAADNSQWLGTGWFIGPHTVATAGHVVYIKNGGVPGRDSVPARLMPGELVVPTHMVASGKVDHLRGQLPGFGSGGRVRGGDGASLPGYADGGLARLRAALAQPPGRGIAWANAFEPGIRALSLAIGFDALRSYDGLTADGARAIIAEHIETFEREIRAVL